MYHAHFGLERGLFGEGIASDATVFRSARHDRLVAHFKLALASPSSCIVLFGPPGVGKTTLTSAALRASSTRLALAWVGGMATNAAELLELVLVELGINTLRTTRIERLQLWRQFLGEMRATDSRLFIVAERTEDLSVEVLHALDQLTAPDAAGNSGANVVLLGHASIDEHLAAPLLDSLRQRIRFRAELEPFTEAELQDYLRHQVACAGGHFDRLFAPGTVAALYRYSRGVTRLANTLCESALDIAAVQQQKQLTPDLVAKTAVSLLGLAEPAAARATGLATRVEPVVAPSAQPRAAASPVSAAAAAPPPVTTAPVAAAPAEVTRVVATPIAAAPIAAAPVAATPVATAPIAAPPVAAAPPAVERTAEPVVVTTQPAAVAVTTAAPQSRPAPSPPPPASPPPVAAVAAAPLAASTPPAAPAPPNPVEIEFDGGATDVADVASADFPVLTDAVEVPAPTPKPAAPAPAPTLAATPAPAKPPPAAASRVATAYTAPRPAAKPMAPAPIATPVPPAPPPAAPPPAARVAPPKPAPQAPEPQDSDADDVLRQTQTMRAIASAKSLDDISEVDAETLFGDAELDLVSAALASAAEWPDDDYSAPAPTPARPEAAKPEPSKPAAKAEPPKAPPPEDDPFDLFGLGDDAPLELIDDSTLPPASPARRTAVR